MTAEQFAKLLEVLSKLAEKQHYTITGAADWPILVVVGGGCLAMLMAAIGCMWADLRSWIKEGREEWRGEIKEHKAENERDQKEYKAENERDHDLIWAAMRDCQGDCCPRKKD
jgi:hypothetical protein